MADPTLSLIVITRNEAHRIGRCLASVPCADQRVVVDSGSTDDTVAIARAAGAQVVPTGDWPGFGPQKNRALAFARGRCAFSGGPLMAALRADQHLAVFVGVFGIAFGAGRQRAHGGSFSGGAESRALYKVLLQIGGCGTPAPPKSRCAVEGDV